MRLERPGGRTEHKHLFLVFPHTVSSVPWGGAIIKKYSATTERDLRQPLRDERRRRACKHEALRLRNCRKLESLRQRFGEQVTVRVSAGAAPLRLLAQAQRAATSKDVRARVTPAGKTSRSVSLWDESRVWDPGD